MSTTSTAPPQAQTQAAWGETSQYRDVLAKYCTGYGVDIGFGGDPISPTAIRVDLPTPYVHVGDFPVQLGGDCRDLFWFRDGVLDFVYSSHVLEDFTEAETGPVMKEWSRLLRQGGRLILLLPDQQRYLAYCRKTNQIDPATGIVGNVHHSIPHFSMEYVVGVAEQLGHLKVVASHPELGPYSFGLVLERTTVPESIAEAADLRRKYDAIVQDHNQLKARETEVRLARLEIDRLRGRSLGQRLNEGVMYYVNGSARVLRRNMAKMRR